MPATAAARMGPANVLRMVAVLRVVRPGQVSAEVVEEGALQARE